MTQEERLDQLIALLLQERQEYEQNGLKKERAWYGRQESERFGLPRNMTEKKWLLRALLNIRPPVVPSIELLALQDDYLEEETGRRKITDASELAPVRDQLCLWRGDITALRADAIVNAANSAMLGCFIPNHSCIDNAIHTCAGLQLRLYCRQRMEERGREETPGHAMLTPGFHLPSRYILHTVGPIVRGAVTEADRETLRSCYRSCLTLARDHGFRSVAFCCISTGEYHFPNAEAAKIAVDTVSRTLQEFQSGMKVVFNVFKEYDEQLYRALLAGGGAET